MLSAAILMSTVATGTLACEYKEHDIRVVASPDFYVQACDGVVDAIKFFENIGYDDTYTLNVTIQDEVLVDIEGSDKTIQVFGMYDAKHDVTLVSSFGTPYMNGRTAWLTNSDDLTSGVPVTLAVWQSVVTHEAAHQILQNLWEVRNPMLVKNKMFIGHGLHEYVAYVAQLTMMPEADRNEIIESYGDVTGYKWPEALNGVRHFLHPHKFGVQSYLSDNVDWINDIITGQIVSFDSSM